MSLASLSPFFVESRVLLTPLSPAQCAARLADALLDWRNLPEWSPTNPRLKNPVAGSVSADGFRVEKWSRYRGWSKVTAAGEFVRTRDGTRVVVRLSLRRRVAALLVFYFALLLVAQVFTLYWHLGGAASLSTLGAFAPGLAALAGGALYLMGWRLAREEGEFLVEFLRDTLKAAHAQAA